MEFIDNEVSEIKQKPGFDGMIEQIDLCTGICYGRTQAHSIEKQREFVDKLIKANHMRGLEFGTVYLTFKDEMVIDEVSIFDFLNSYCMFTQIDDTVYLTTNYRYIVENNMEYLLDYISEPTEHHIKRRTFKITCGRAIADEIRTHTTLSGVMQSTRFCNMSDMKVVFPKWITRANKQQIEVYTKALNDAQNSYCKLVNSGISKQYARGVLPFDVATTLIVCGFEGVDNTGWDRFIKLRTASAAHEDLIIIANQIESMLNEG